MFHGMRYLGFALRHTFTSLGGKPLFFSVLAIPFVGFVLHRWIEGAEAMNAELHVYLIYGLAATGLVFLVMFTLNLSCAPYWLEKEAHTTLMGQHQALLAQVKKTASKRRLNDEQKGLCASSLRRSGVSPPSITVSYCVNDESSDFALNIGDAIKQAGIECKVFNSPILDHDPKDRGIKVYHSDERTLTLFAEKFREGLKEFGFECELRESKGMGKFFVYVARSVDV